jgi:hypothetical protein
MSVKFEGMYGPGDVIPPRLPKPAPPGAEVLATQVAAIEATLRDAEAAERALEVERQALKAQQRALEQDQRALNQQRLTPRKREQQEAVMRERQDELDEAGVVLGQREQAARVRAGSAAEALKQARRRLKRARVQAG